MAEAGFLEQKRIRPGSAAIVVLMHGAAITALVMAKGEIPLPNSFIPTEVKSIRLPPEPPPIPERPPEQPRPREQQIQFTAPAIPSPVPSPFTVPEREEVPVPELGSLAGSEEVRVTPDVPRRDPPAPPPAPPVGVAPVLLGANLQPPYPTSEQRAQREGSVVIRVTVGPDGRVASTEKVRATSDAFYEATARHARARWRFRPAMVDGRPVRGTKTLTVNFQLDG